VLPDKFLAGGIISNLPPSWRNFATSLKHKRQEFTINGLIETLDVEEKARAKHIVGKELLVLQAPTFFRSTTPLRIRKSHHKTNG